MFPGFNSHRITLWIRFQSSVCMLALGTPGLEVSLSEPLEDASFPPQTDVSRFSLESCGIPQHLAVLGMGEGHGNQPQLIWQSPCHKWDEHLKMQDYNGL